MLTSLPSATLAEAYLQATCAKAFSRNAHTEENTADHSKWGMFTTPDDIKYFALSSNTHVNIALKFKTKKTLQISILRKRYELLVFG